MNCLSAWQPSKVQLLMFSLIVYANCLIIVSVIEEPVKDDLS